MSALTAPYNPVERFGRGFCRHALEVNLKSFRGQVWLSKKLRQYHRCKFLAEALGVELPADVVDWYQKRRKRQRRPRT